MRKVADVVIIQHKALLTFAATPAASRTTNNGRVENNTRRVIKICIQNTIQTILTKIERT